MNDNDVSYYYKEALATDSFTVHNNFLNMLLQDDSALGMERHYCYFKDSENAYLKRILGKGFLKRGREGMLFLEEKLKTETDALAKSNVIHLIGLSYNKEYLPYILPYLDDADKEIRYKAIIACGWLGDAEAIKILKEHYATEKDALLRGFIVSAMRQIFFRYKETKQQIVDFIYVKMPEETDNELLAIMIVVLQDLTKMKFGLKEESNSGIISGNVTRAVNKVLKMIEK
ncbi:HEAT repeat domain-containing protein [Prevotella nigrescens]